MTHDRVMEWLSPTQQKYPDPRQRVIAVDAERLHELVDAHARLLKKDAAYTEINEWRIVDKFGGTVQTYTDASCALGQPTQCFIEMLDRRLPDHAPHVLKIVCLRDDPFPTPTPPSPNPTRSV